MFNMRYNKLFFLLLPETIRRGSGPAEAADSFLPDRHGTLGCFGFDRHGPVLLQESPPEVPNHEGQPATLWRPGQKGPGSARPGGHHQPVWPDPIACLQGPEGPVWKPGICQRHHGQVLQHFTSPWFPEVRQHQGEVLLRRQEAGWQSPDPEHCPAGPAWQGAGSGLWDCEWTEPLQTSAYPRLSDFEIPTCCLLQWTNGSNSGCYALHGANIPRHGSSGLPWSPNHRQLLHHNHYLRFPWSFLSGSQGRSEINPAD